MKDTKISYDENVDVLYISFGKPKAGIATEESDGVFIRRNDNEEIVGITIMNFNDMIVRDW